MPAYRFSWSAFDDAVVKALAQNEKDWRDDIADARAWLSEQVKRPNEEFVGRNKKTLAALWLPTYAGTTLLVDRLRDAGLGPTNIRPSTTEEAARFVGDTRNSSRLRRMLLDTLIRFGDADRDNQPASAAFTPRFSIIKPAAQPLDDRAPHDYQQAAWEKLSAHLAQGQASGSFRGMLVMPTGSGKTFTAVRWLVEHVVAKGGRVLWLAHRAELLNQAAREFHKLAAHAAPKERFRVRIVSSEHCATTQIDPQDDVVVSSIGSVSRRLDLIDAVMKDPRSFVVIDEAHHAVARSYRNVIARFEGASGRLLGLTATPTRTAEDERPMLSRLFGDRILYSVSTTELIERGLLARPVPITVLTGAKVEDGVTPADLENMARFDELSEAWLARIAAMVPRNREIVGHYTQNKEKYGKTLIFALNVEHAALLTHMLKEADVAAEYVASYRVDEDAVDNTEILQRFREKDGGIDVLVNVQIVTEGVDLPNVQTVFLTRPTHSEILLRQMIGRALRGPAAGGKDTAYIVSFEDHWERFRDWQGQLALVPDIIAPTQPSEAEPAGRPSADDETHADDLLESMRVALPWDAVVELVREIRLRGPGHEADAFEALHHGWYVLEREDEGEPVRQTIAVYQHQLPCWEQLFKVLYSLSAERLERASAEALFDEFFSDCDSPAPGTEQLRAALEHVRARGERPTFRPLKEREQCDPAALARIISDEDLGERRRQQLLDERYTPLARVVYPTSRAFQSAVNDALYELEHPDEATHVPRAVPVFEPGPKDQMTLGPHHSLPTLFADVLRQGSALLDADLSTSASVSPQWSNRILKNVYGWAKWQPNEAHGQGRIMINRLLDSPDVSADTLKFLLWHEFLHLHLQALHTPTFRELERKWPGHQDAHRELFNLGERFGVTYW